ncbi:50S ribosomal protein L19 [Candidatus Marinimicrobia bacterium MT.SAG.3]|nr:50S ribosomal protein L19 [Candidatus Neomarinimicrobiota bacterium]MCH8305253.1 50S ribosomal protein L19 [Candidatus Neomarinimicrobiota bacterium]TFB11083.1 50S ribosomal protein L19 [Candidatus Marinimicrobia bacterium MT.SAG.2]TFB12457.1 50S ribosomal protein L19 [Candidatus Marinimicrobia bacterium MT.SAG.4]TFB12506.1 50S ribosomal protein L19 [Candidatus Marinimicrobia bacterium MT.SAG.3]
MNKVQEYGKTQMKDEILDFRAGDTLSVDVRIREAGKERTQKFEGVVIQIRGVGADKTFTIRKVSQGVGVERIFPIHSPSILGMKKIKAGKVRRSKIFYLRKLRGKAARIAEKREN